MTLSKKRRFEIPARLHLQFKHRFVRPDIEKRVSFRGMNLDYTRVTSAAEYDFSSVGACHYLALHDLVLESGELDVVEMPTIPGGDLRGKMTYIPAGRPLSGWAKATGRQSSFTILHFDAALLSEETERVFGSGETLPLIYFDDPQLLVTMKKLEALAADGVDHPRIYVETLALLATLELGRLQGPGFQPGDRTGLLSRQQETLLRDFIEANLAVDISLDDLAGIVRLSRFHFSRRFKASFGSPPHQYVTHRRVELAQRLLKASDLSVDAVGLAVGYALPGPFIKAFKKVTGVTPAAFRRG